MISENTMGTPSSTPSSTPDYGAWAIATPSPTPTSTSSSESETPLPTSTNSSLSFVSPTLTLAPTTSLPTITSTGSAAHHNQAFLSIIMWHRGILRAKMGTPVQGVHFVPVQCPYSTELRFPLSGCRARSWSATDDPNEPCGEFGRERQVLSPWFVMVTSGLSVTRVTLN
ncbi:hypothetical protein EDB81DRAFT_761688 [Dactylonectria macrodidyma]|uniref:Uncharacterized protein n=1 Tax=Dactylonectria macrodidyma TaxID=307937 RepID=A0A9P9J0H2_9HYPO|nr:hypothetical protein EDB81DRAFT_761688 [Dactylonectria macrodidyma]